MAITSRKRNLFFLRWKKIKETPLTSYLDGIPARSKMQITFPESKIDVSTDETGFAEITFNPRDNQSVKIGVSVNVFRLKDVIKRLVL